MIIIGVYGQMTFGESALFYFGVLFIFLSHLFVSASLDLMNPQNEQYATSGEVENNKNESVSTLIAFAGSLVIALFSFFLFRESAFATGGTFVSVLKLFLLAFYVISFACSNTRVIVDILRIRKTFALLFQNFLCICFFLVSS